jgi:formyltetrahydrofolate synthetase
VLVATTQALKHHGGDPDGGVAAIERGADNLEANMRIVREFGIVPVVAVNRFPGDDALEVDAICRLALELGAFAAEVNDGFTRGGSGAERLAEVVVEAAARGGDVHPLYELDEPIPAKIEAIAKRAYGADGIELSPLAAKQAEDAALERLPVCIAKTHLSLSHDPALGGTPKGFTLPVRELRPYTGAGWVVALCGDMQTMPGLPAEPAAKRIDVDAEGCVTGLR